MGSASQDRFRRHGRVRRRSRSVCAELFMNEVLQVTDPAARAHRQPGRLELRAFAGLSLASAAISIDLILPAFGRIRADLNLAPDSAATAGLVTAFFLGMAGGAIPIPPPGRPFW